MTVNVIYSKLPVKRARPRPGDGLERGDPEGAITSPRRSHRAPGQSLAIGLDSGPRIW